MDAWLQDIPEEAREPLIAHLERELAKSKLYDYVPYPKQKEFHALGATKRERLFRAGNQLGKTLGVGAEVAYHLTGQYPDWWEGRVFKKAPVIWASSETGEATRDNPQRILCGAVGELGTGLIPANCLGDSGRAMGTADLLDYIRIKHTSGGQSLLRFKHYAQGRARWQGPTVDFVWFDEEPPLEIYNEGLARTIASKGCVALSFTPLMGMSEVVQKFLMSDSPDRSDTNMTIYDVGHINEEERDRIIASFPEHQRDARALGVPTVGSGLIFPVTESSLKCDPFEPPSYWPQIGGLDFGWDHPTAAVKLAWDRDTDTVYVTSVYQKQKATPLIHAAALKPWGEWLPWAWPMDGLQTGKSDGMQLRSVYKNLGLNMLGEHATFDSTAKGKVSVEAGIIMMLERMQSGRFKVFSHLEDWFKEYRLYHRKDGVIVKVRDDLLDATRYGMMMLRHAITPSKAKTRLRSASTFPKTCVRRNPHTIRHSHAHA